MKDSKKDVLKRIEDTLEDIKKILFKELEILTGLVQPTNLNLTSEQPHLWVSLTEPNKSGLGAEERMRQFQADIHVEEQNLKIAGEYLDKLTQNCQQTEK